MAAEIRITLDTVAVPNMAADKNVAKDISWVRIFSEFHILIEVFVVCILGIFLFFFSLLYLIGFLSAL